MKLVTQPISKTEIVHCMSDDVLVTSQGNCITYTIQQKTGHISLPIKPLLKLPLQARKARRALRLDKMNIAFSNDLAHMVIVYRGQVYHFDLSQKKLRPVMTLNNCRNVLHQSILSLNDQTLFMGEYGSNPQRTHVPLYRSIDGGKNWEIVYNFPDSSIKHIHGCYYDPFTDTIWVATGDFEGECWFVIFDKAGNKLGQVGDGTQKYRAVNLFFTKNYVYWVMDSQLETSYLVKFDRQTEQTVIGVDFPGPVWYCKTLTDGYYLVATANEIGPGVKTDCAHLYVSTDLESWSEIASFRHDSWPKRYFKFGVIGFADGEQSSQDFVLFGEALKGLDGKALRCSLCH